MYGAGEIGRQVAASCLATSLPVIHFDSDADEIDDDDDDDEADEADYASGHDVIDGHEKTNNR